MIPRILIVAGSDSGGGAGIQADIKTVTMLGGHAMTAITAITAQNTLGVTDVMAVPARMVIAQIDAVADDIGIDAIKIGMIGSAATAEAVADRLERFSGIPILFDPVMVATSGAPLVDAATVAAFGRLMALATVTTPNIPELELLSDRRIGTVGEMESAARLLVERYGGAVLAKGGHLPGVHLVDMLVEPLGVVRWEGERIATRHSHGTGCTLASGIVTLLGGGKYMAEAIDIARKYVRAALLSAPGLGAGHGPMGHGLGRVHFDGSGHE